MAMSILFFCAKLFTTKFPTPCEIFTICPRFSPFGQDFHHLAKIFSMPRFSRFGQDFHDLAKIFSMPRFSRFGRDFPDRPTEFSNGRKIARIAPNLTIFGRFCSRRPDLYFEKICRRRKKIASSSKNVFRTCSERTCSERVPTERCSR